MSTASDLAPPQEGPILAATLPSTRKPRQIFVAYSYRLYPKADYRRVFKELAKAFAVTFVFADEKITSLHILDKIAGMIRESTFGIYDISGWNANVTLELGLAMGMRERIYITIDPSKTPVEDVPSDLRGIDRMQYSSYTELGLNLESLLAQEMPVPRQHAAENQLTELREQALDVIREAEQGLKVGDIARVLGVSVDLAKVVIRPLVGVRLRAQGVRRGTHYFVIEPTELGG